MFDGLSRWMSVILAFIGYPLVNYNKIKALGCKGDGCPALSKALFKATMALPLTQ